MPVRSKILTLPEDVKSKLDERLIKEGFSNYEALSGWLSDQGFEISRSAIHRYGQDFENRLGMIRVATEQARAIVQAAGDEEGSMNEALIRLVQQEAFNVLVGLNDEDKNALLPKIGVMVAKLSRASVDQKKWAAEMKAKVKTAADEVVKVARSGGLSADKVNEIKKRILGVV